jgi:hypothetical protein
MKLPHGLAEESMKALTPDQVFESLSNSIILGVVLMLVTLWANHRLVRNAGPDSRETKNMTPHSMLMSSSNVLFFTFGMTGVMLLVNNNLARAFAIGAAIALIRFKIKIDATSQGMALFYAVLAGMACGVDQPLVGWGMTVFFAIGQVSIMTYGSPRIRVAAEEPAPAPAKN